MAKKDVDFDLLDDEMEDFIDEKPAKKPATKKASKKEAPAKKTSKKSAKEKAVPSGVVSLRLPLTLVEEIERLKEKGIKPAKLFTEFCEEKLVKDKKCPVCNQKLP